MAKDNKALIEGLIADVWNRGEYDRLPHLVAESYIGHPSGVVGTAAYRRYYEGLRQASSDIAFSIEDQVAEGDPVVTRWTARGTTPAIRWSLQHGPHIRVHRHQHAPHRWRQGRGVLDRHGRDGAASPVGRGPCARLRLIAPQVAAAPRP